MTCECVVCGEELEDAVPNPKGLQPYRGVAFRTYGHYGSTAFDPMNGEWVEIALCDECFTQAPRYEGFYRDIRHEDAGDDYRLSSATRKEWAERALAAEAQIKCPIDLDATPELCSAGTCPKCLSERALKAEERVKELEAQQKRDHANINLKADFIEKTMGDFHEMEAERDRLREALEAIANASPLIMAVTCRDIARAALKGET